MYSIITPFIGDTEQLKELSNSIRNYGDNCDSWIIVDGNPRSREIEVRQAVSVGMDKIKYLSSPKSSIYGAINVGLEVCRASYYVVFGADDLLAPNISDVVVVLSEHTPDILVTCTLNKKKNITQAKHWLGGWHLLESHSGACFIRKELHNKFGNYSDKYKILSDLEFILKVYDSGEHKIQYSNIKTANIGLAGISQKRMWQSTMENYHIQIARGQSKLVQGMILAYRGLRLMLKRRSV